MTQVRFDVREITGTDPQIGPVDEAVFVVAPGRTLEDGGYIEFTDKRATAYNAYRRDAVIQLTKAGVDLVEGTRDDPGVDV